MILFQGLAGAQFNATWTFANGSWVQLHVLHSPPPLWGASMVYDAADREVVLFGGGALGEGPYSNDTWVFSGADWSVLNASAAGAPPARGNPSMSYDPTIGKVVLFGGTNRSWNYRTCLGWTFRDTWGFSAGHWGRVGGANPPEARFGASLAFDPATGGLLLFGGGFLFCNRNYTTAWNDTWTYLHGRWSQTNTSGAPPGRWGAAFTYDPSDSEFVLFGGGTFSQLNDSWIYANASWRPIPGPQPPGSDGASPLISGLLSGALFLFGIPAWAFSRGNWTSLDPRPVPPTYNGGLLMAYDAKDGYILFVISGPTYDTHPVATWKFQNGAWTELSAGRSGDPLTGNGATMAYDPVDQYVVLFGGNFNVTWTFQGGSWTRLNLTTEPPARWGTALAFDPIDGYLLMFGGSDCYPGYWWIGCTWSSASWGFVDGAWFQIQLRSGDVPPARAYAALVFDSAEGYMLMFGGLECAPPANCTVANDSLAFAHGTWTSLRTVASPRARAFAGIAYDAANESVVLTGGSGVDSSGGYNGATKDTWSFSNGAWHNVSFGSTFVPTAAFSPGFGYIPELRLDLLVLTSGQTWQLQLAATTSGPPGALRASAQEAPAAGDAAVTIHVVGSAAGGVPPDYYLWNFGDGASGEGATTNHTYNTSGAFLVSMVVVDAAGEQANAWLNVTVFAALNVSASLTPWSGFAPLPITYRAAVQGGGAPFLIRWDFGDGANGVLLDGSHTFTNAGTFTVSLLVSDRFGTTASGGPWIVHVSRPLPLVVSLNSSSNSVTLGQSVELNARVQGGSGAISYSWQGLPNGCASAIGPSLNCTPTAVGTYAPSLTASDSAGQFSSSSTIVSVVPPKLNFALTASPSVSSLGTPVVIASQYSGGVPPISLRWGPLPGGCRAVGSTSVNCDVPAVGVFSVEAEVSDKSGQSANATVSIIVEAPAVTARGPSLGPFGLSGGQELALGFGIGVVAAALVTWFSVRRRAGPR
ncbi:MAG: PKD domain-containing protein [Thermoplasmata archaeon]|nr:PKD domain-containing protein [Thermoplasmata archaeon]